MVIKSQQNQQEEEEMIDPQEEEIEGMVIEILAEVLKLSMNVGIVVKKAIGKMNVENQEDRDQDLEKEKDLILVVPEVVLMIKDIIKKENIHQAVAEVQLLNIKGQEKIEVKAKVVKADQVLPDPNHQDLNLVKVIVKKVMKINLNQKVLKKKKMEMDRKIIIIELIDTFCLI